MNGIAQFLRRLWLLVRRERFRSELDEEMAFHRAQAEKDFTAEGMTPNQARHAAIRQFGNAVKLREQLEARYEMAKVIDFEGPTGYWVRIRPEGDNREEAERIARKLKPVEGDAYLVRLD